MATLATYKRELIEKGKKGNLRLVHRATGTALGTITFVHKTPSQGQWNGNFSIKLADGTVENIVITGTPKNTASGVARLFEAAVAGKDIVYNQAVTTTVVEAQPA